MSVILGIFFHAIGGFAAGSFYIPMNLLKKWAWESGWLVLGLAAWLLSPWLIGWLTVSDLTGAISQAPSSSIFWSYFFGLLWGVGGLTFGLTMRYLGLSLGMALALGLTAAFGTLVPPIYEGQFLQLIQTRGGAVTLAGVLICLLGIGVCGWAGVRKEKELDIAQKKAGVKEFDLWRGIVTAVIAGILSACFAFGLQAGEPIAQSAVRLGTTELFQNNAILVVILAGGITTNFLYCIWLNLKRGTYRDYRDASAPLSRNYLLASLGGITWYLQFFFYGMGVTKLGDRFDFASWTLHMAFIIIFSNLWGMYFREWRGVGRSTMTTQIGGLLIILFSVILIGMGNRF